MGRLVLELSARNLPNVDKFGKSDPYVCVFIVCSNGSLKFLGKTEVVKNNLNPSWKPLELSDFELDNINDETVFNFQVN